SDGGVSDPEQRPDTFRERAGDYDRNGTSGKEDEHDDRDDEPERDRPPDRPAFLDVPDYVRRSNERADVARGRPDGAGDPHDEKDPRRAAALGQPVERVFENL